MKAMILAAGLGTRLKPLTDNKPKALIEINNTPLLEIVINYLKKFGFTDIIVNMHHFADQIKDFLKRNNYFNINISVSDESDLLLDTGGGLKKASWFFDDDKPFLIHNVDVISNIDLDEFYKFHLSSGALATLAVRNRESSRYLLLDKENILCGWKHIKSNETKIVRKFIGKLLPIAFSGIHVLNPSIFNFMPNENAFSIIDFYLSLAPDHKISAFKHDESFWIDLGRKENLAEAEKFLS